MGILVTILTGTLIFLVIRLLQEFGFFTVIKSIFNSTEKKVDPIIENRYRQNLRHSTKSVYPKEIDTKFNDYKEWQTYLNELEFQDISDLVHKIETLRLEIKLNISEDTFVRHLPSPSYKKSFVLANNPIAVISSGRDTELISSDGTMEFYTENRLVSHQEYHVVRYQINQSEIKIDSYT